MSSTQFSEALSITQLHAEGLLAFLEDVENLEFTPPQRQLVDRVQRELVALQEATNARSSYRVIDGRCFRPGGTRLHNAIVVTNQS